MEGRKRAECPMLPLLDIIYTMRIPGGGGVKVYGVLRMRALPGRTAAFCKGVVMLPLYSLQAGFKIKPGFRRKAATSLQAQTLKLKRMRASLLAAKRRNHEAVTLKEIHEKCR